MSKTKLTLKIAQSIARANGMSIRKMQVGDYRICFIGDKEIHAAYEESIDDALDTAQMMHYNKYKGLKRYWVE